MNNTINNRVPGIPETYQEVAIEANLAFDRKMKELRETMSNILGVSKTYLDNTTMGPTAQSHARN